MRRSILCAALLTAMAGDPAPAEADPRERPTAQLPPHVEVVPGHPVGSATPSWRDPDVLPGHRHRGPWWRQTTPWHYHPQGACAPPWCLPAYHRHRGFLADPRAVPLERVLERLKGQDYHSFGRVVLEGANYRIDARSRYGRPVRLIVNAGNGQIRRVLQ